MLPLSTELWHPPMMVLGFVQARTDFKALPKQSTSAVGAPRLVDSIQRALLGVR
jgi:hypothetical protein